jgi:hypothetical protein
MKNNFSAHISQKALDRAPMFSIPSGSKAVTTASGGLAYMHSTPRSIQVMCRLTHTKAKIYTALCSHGEFSL